MTVNTTEPPKGDCFVVDIAVEAAQEVLGRKLTDDERFCLVLGARAMGEALVLVRAIKQ